jgi:hypothetical protein
VGPSGEGLSLGYTSKVGPSGEGLSLGYTSKVGPSEDGEGSAGLGEWLGEMNSSRQSVALVALVPLVPLIPPHLSQHHSVPLTIQQAPLAGEGDGVGLLLGLSLPEGMGLGLSVALGLKLGEGLGVGLFGMSMQLDGRVTDHMQKGTNVHGIGAPQGMGPAAALQVTTESRGRPRELSKFRTINGLNVWHAISWKMAKDSCSPGRPAWHSVKLDWSPWSVQVGVPVQSAACVQT